MASATRGTLGETDAAMAWDAELRILTEAGIAIASGLSTAEAERAEAVIGAAFPPDLRAFLSEGLPLGGRFPNWREPDSDAIRDQLAWPFEGIAFDIEKNAFWEAEWGPRPHALSDALDIARREVAAAPRLIPVCGHRYLPAEPAVAGNPIFSVYQTDIIYYGRDLAIWLRLEFGGLPYADAVRDRPRAIRFWVDLAG